MKSYFVFLYRHKLYTSIQAVGLIISIAFIILIGNYVWQQYRLAYSNKYTDRIFAVGSDKYAALSEDDKSELEVKLPSIEGVTRMSNQKIVLNINGEQKELPMLEVDKDFFELFPEFELTKGNRQNFIPGSSILVSEEFVRNNYPDEDPIGKNMGGGWTIGGIFKINSPTILQETDVIWILGNEKDEDRTPFSSIGTYITFIKVPESTDIKELELTINKILRPYYDEKWIKGFKLYSLPALYFNNDLSWHLKNGNKEMLKLLIGVVILLLISSMINYINLNLALSGRRAKEMATHLLLGSSKKLMIWRNVKESLVFILVCSIIGIGLAYIFLKPIDHLLVNISLNGNMELWRFIHLSIKWNVASIFMFIGFILVLGIISGLMPALYSSRYKPIDVVKGVVQTRNRQIFGKVFIIFQNILAVMLISLAIVMECQLNHIRKMPLYSNSKNIYMLQSFFATYEEAIPLIDRLNKIPDIKKIGYGTNYPGFIGMYTTIKLKEDEGISTGIMRGDRNYFDIMGLNVISGISDPKVSGMLYLSESAANEMGVKDELTASKYLNSIVFNGTPVSVFGGIYKNVPNRSASTSEFNYDSAFLLSDGMNMPYSNSLLLETINESEELENKIMTAYEEYIKELRGVYMEPWTNGFISNLNEKYFVPIKSTIALLEIFMAISIILSLLGLIAMSTYYANENTKGIAIRKVLGSDVKGEIWRNIRLYMILVLIAIAVATPLAIIVSREYLSRFAYRIENYWWIFVVSSVCSLLIAFLSVYCQISRSAHINPATELKKE
ncbi:MAG: FtsX-like permease family protein [Muribaculaceae bacterium]|nr:FtsX-like permease family protein [Muribaculaceae bacterium]